MNITIAKQLCLMMEALVDNLLRACAEGDISLLVTCLQYGLDLNFITNDGLTPLMYAITYAGTKLYGDYYQVVSMLLEAGSDPFAVDATYGRTAAHWAAYCKQADILVLLISAGSDITVLDIEGLSTFHIAVSNGLNECVELMIQTIPNLNLNGATLTGMTPLMLATLGRNSKLTYLLLNYGCDPNVINPQTLQSSLHMAAEDGNADIVGVLLKFQATLDTNDSRGLTPIHLACSNATSDVLSTICDHVGNVVLDLTDSVGLTPLMHACINGSESCVEFIVKKKANILFKDNIEGKTCLHWAVENVTCSPSIVKLLCKKKKQLLSETDVQKRLPIHSAVISGHTEALKVLLDFDCNFTLTDNNQYTAIHYAAACGQSLILQELIARGCPLNLTEENGATPLHLAVQAAAAKDDQALLAASDGALVCIDILLKAGASLTAKDIEGREPLHWALQCFDNLEAVQLLVSKGANPSAMSYDGLTGLHIAAKYGITDNCRYLIEVVGIDGNIIDEHGQSALFYSIESQAIDCSMYLLSIGLSANHKNKEGRNPVHIAATVGSVEGLELLLSYNGDMNALSFQNITPVHDAAANGKTGALKFLLNSGGNPNRITDHTVPSPLHYAVSEGYKDCVQLLLDAGANVNSFILSENVCLTPLDYASEFPELREILIERNGLQGVDISLPETEKQTSAEMEGKVSEEHFIQELEDEETQNVTDIVVGDHEDTDDKDQAKDMEVVTPTFLRPQVDRKHSDPFEITTKPHTKPSILSRLIKLGHQKPATPTIQSSVIGFFGAQATMLAAGIIRTPLGDKAFEVANKVAKDAADELKRAAACEIEEVPELDWLETPIKEPTPTPEPSPEIPPTPQPSPPPQFQLDISPNERRMRKAKAQMDESKSLAFRAVEELLKAQNTQSQLKRQFVMAQLKEESEIRQKEIIKLEEESLMKRDQLLSHYQQRMEKAVHTSQKVNDHIVQQLENAHRVNTEISKSMSELGISPRPTVSEWLKRKNDEKKDSLKTTLHSWNKTKQQREVAISLKQAITSHRALRHIAWGTKKELVAQIHATKKPKSQLIIAEEPKAIPKKPSNVKEKPIHKVTVTTGCIRTTPLHYLNLNTELTRHRSSSLPNCALWDIGQRYVESSKVAFYRNLGNRAYGPKTIHAERTLHFVSPSEYRRKRILISSNEMMKPHSTTQYHSYDERKSRTIEPT